MMVRVFANGPGDRGSIPGRVIPNTKKMVLDASLLNTQHTLANFTYYLCGFKYSHPIQIIFKQIYSSYRWDSKKYYHFG